MKRTHSTRMLQHVASGLIVVATVVGLGTGPSFAATPHTGSFAGPQHHARAPKTPAPTGVSAAGSTADAVQHNRPSIGQIPPQRPLPEQTAHKLMAAGTATTATQSCTPSDFSSRSGSDLASYIEGSTTDCINSLFTVTGSDANGVFQESQMLSVASAFQSLAQNYSGDDSSGIWQLALYLRAGYYVQFYHPGDVGTYDDNLASQVRYGLDDFFGSPHSQDVTDANGQVLGDVVTLTDSANLQQDYLSDYERILDSYDSSWDSSSAMDAVVYDVYTPLWRGQYNPAFVTAITNDSTLIDTLHSFALSHTDQLGGDNTFMDSDAGQDLAAYVQFPALQSTVRPMMLELLNDSQMTGSTAALWVAVAEQTNYFDNANCSYYGTCDVAAQLTSAVLPTKDICTSTITITAQALDSSQLAAVCSSLSDQVPYFANLVNASGPIQGQNISGENMVVFSSRLDYQIYAPAIYGVDTNNGGITIVGDPSQPGNSAYSLMYQASYATDFTADIWNLNHEFTHYLDAVYDTKGDFNAEIAVPDVWWIEGIAEYTSYSYRNVTDTQALNEAPLHTYKLSTLFQSTYDNSDATRTYPWGYLAVRYMTERHPSDLTTVLNYFRQGDYQSAYNYYNNSIGTAYDADFDSWLNTL